MSKHLLNVRPQTLVILCDVLLPLIPGLTIDHLDYLDLQQPGEEHREREPDHGDGGDTKGKPGLVAQHGRQVREDEGEDAEQSDLAFHVPDEVPVVDVAVEPYCHYVDAQCEEVAMVGVAHARSCEPAVVVMLQRADLAQRTVVRPRGEIGLAGTAVTPTRGARAGGEHDILPCDIRQVHHQPVAVDVDSEEDPKEEVDRVCH